MVVLTFVTKAARACIRLAIAGPASLIGLEVSSEALRRGDADVPSNMQWETKSEAMAKDRVE